MVRVISFFLYSAIAVLIFLSCNTVKRDDNSKLDFIYTKAKRNFDTSRDSACYFYKLAREQKVDTTHLKQTTYLNYLRGNCMFQQAKYDSAFFAYKKAAQCNTFDSVFKANLLFNALVAIQTGRLKELDQAIYFEVNKLVAKLGDKNLEGRFLGYRGTLFARKGAYEKALKLFLAADSLYRAEDLEPKRAFYLSNIGAQYQRLGNSDKAFVFYLKALHLCQKWKLTRQEMSVVYNLGKLYRRTGRYQESERYYAKFLLHAKQHSDLKMTAKAYDALGILNCEKRNFIQGLTYFDSAYVVKKHLNDPAGVAVALNNIGNAYLRFGEGDSALAYFNQSLNVRLDNGLSTPGIIRNLNNIASVYDKQEKHAKADSLYNRVLTHAIEHSDTVRMSELYYTLGKLYQKQGNFKIASTHLNKHIELSKILAGKEAIDKLNDLMVRYQSAQRKQELRVKNVELTRKKQQNFYVSGMLLLVIVLGGVLWLRSLEKIKAMKIIVEERNMILEQKKEIKELKVKLDIDKQQEKQVNLMNKLKWLMTKEKYFTQQDVSLDSLARQLNTNTSYVSGLINTVFNCNFKTLINKLRVDYCIVLMKDEELKDYTLKEIANEAGFTSMSTFYSIFKKETGETPSNYRLQQKV